MPIPDTLSTELADKFPVSVLMARHEVRDNPWIDHRWEAAGVVMGRHGGEPGSAQSALRRDGIEEVIYKGYEVRLYKDECESYFHNLRSQEPRCYVITRADDGGTPRPFLVSLSFDEAHAYLEGDDVELFALDIPPALYRWTEAYVLQHYVPEPRKKRKRDNWKEKRP